MKKITLFIFIIFPFTFLLSIPFNGYAQSSFDPATITDSSFKAFLPKWEIYVDSIASGNPTLLKEKASHTDDVTILAHLADMKRDGNK